VILGVCENMEEEQDIMKKHKKMAHIKLVLIDFNLLIP